MNIVILIGRLTKDFTQVGKTARSTVACDKGFTKGSDFIDITAINKTVDFCLKYGRKGQLVSIEGRWDTYKNNEGKMVSACVISKFEILSKKEDNEVRVNEQSIVPLVDEEIPDITNDDLPF